MWRYQPVYVNEDKDTKVYSICEVYLDEKGNLSSWTEDRYMYPYGETTEELQDVLKMMLSDVQKWKPVDFKQMKIGLEFEQNQTKS